MPRVVTKKASAAVSLRDGRARLALVADTHSSPHPRTEELLRELRPDVILHAGDIGARRVIEDLGRIAPTLAVRGNIDTTATDLPDELVVDVRDEASGESLFSIFLVHIAVYGPKLRAEIARRAKQAGASVVVCGHSHVPFVGRDQGLTIVNPGSVGPRRFQLPIVFGVMDVEREDVSVRHVSCETGERWTP